MGIYPTEVEQEEVVWGYDGFTDECFTARGDCLCSQRHERTQVIDHQRERDRDNHMLDSDASE